MHLGGNEETFSEAMVREAREEVGVEFDLADLELVHVMHSKQRESTDEKRVNLFLLRRNGKVNPEFTEGFS